MQFPSEAKLQMKGRTQGMPAEGSARPSLGASLG